LSRLPALRSARIRRRKVQAAITTISRNAAVHPPGKYTRKSQHAEGGAGTSVERNRRSRLAGDWNKLLRRRVEQHIIAPRACRLISKGSQS